MRMKVLLINGSPHIHGCTFTALSEVENALVNIRLRKEEYTAQSDVRNSAQQAADLSIQRYKEGLVSFLEVIDAERSRLDSERDAIKIQSETLIAAVQLIKAIGGGWASGAGVNK